MKYLYTLSVFLLVLFSRNIAKAQSGLLSRIDTNIVINYNGEPLRYHQYIKLLKTGEFYVTTNFSRDYKNVSKELVKSPPLGIRI